jgi:hypothetical protein
VSVGHIGSTDFAARRKADPVSELLQHSGLDRPYFLTIDNVKPLCDDRSQHRLAKHMEVAFHGLDDPLAVFWCERFLIDRKGE